MKLLMSLSSTSQSVSTRLFYTFNELLQHLGLQRYSVEGQPLLEYNSTETVHLAWGSKRIDLKVSRDSAGSYSAELPGKDIKYYVVNKVGRVIRTFNSTDSITVPVLQAIRYNDAKYENETDSDVPSRILQVYKGKYKAGDSITEYMSVVPWASCKNGTKTRRD